MKTLSTPVTNEKNAEQSGWCEVYDIYLKSAITTPWGSVSTLRLTDLPGGLSFFTPKVEPEPSGTQGNAATYNHWPIARETINSDVKFTNDKVIITASNVTQQWAQMIADIDWEGSSVIIRSVSTTVAAATADDCVVIFSGQVDKPGISTQAIQLECSSDLAHFDVLIPREPMHAGCRFRFYDDYCTKIRFHADHYKEKTCGSSSTTTLVKSAGLNEDTGANGSYGTDLVDPLSTGAITTSSELAGQEGYRVRTADGPRWSLGTDADWGTLTQGYWQIPDAQAGLANFALKPWIQFDFGSAKRARLWRLLGRTDQGFDVTPRLVQIFSSTDNVSWKHETNFEQPPRVWARGDCIIHGAQNARYWRICTRSRWSSNLGVSMFEEIQAYEGSRNYWAFGTITFKSNTTTVALRGISAAVLQSYSGEIVTTPLPVAPANGDVFVIERGCPRTFNGCAERQNWENFGGFDSIPFETVVR